MRQYIESILKGVLSLLEMEYPEKTIIETPKYEKFGDISTNIAMLLAKEYKKNPRSLAETIIPYIERMDDIEKVSIDGPGFINIQFSKEYWHQQFLDLEHRPLFTPQQHNEHVLIEFVSANPTGPLHIGHARGAAFGDALRRIFEYAGYAVDTEYYVNDAGNQMSMLGYSVYLRLRELHALPTVFPEEYYKGEYIIDIAKTLDTHYPTLYSLEEEEAIRECQSYATQVIINSIKEELCIFRVEHTAWFYESALLRNNKVEHTLKVLWEKGLLYEKEGALWFESTRFGDDKDRVVKKQDNSYTYFAFDIAYHAYKLERGYDILFDVLGADHHGYVQRLQASVRALCVKPVQLYTPLIQLVSLIRDGKPLSMSTRAGMFETLRELIEEVGVDAARFIFLSRKSDSPLEFDLDIVTKKTMDNPVYYVQYAHARIHSLLKRYMIEISQESIYEMTTTQKLVESEEIALIKQLLSFSQCIELCLHNVAPHYLTQFLTSLAELFHRYYARYPLCSSNTPELSCIRLRLCKKVQECIQIGLSLLGISAPEEM